MRNARVTIAKTLFYIYFADSVKDFLRFAYARYRGAFLPW